MSSGKCGEPRDADLRCVLVQILISVDGNNINGNNSLCVLLFKPWHRELPWASWAWFTLVGPVGALGQGS